MILKINILGNIISEKVDQILTETPIRATELGANSLAGSVKRKTYLLLFRGLSS